jgi:hypothetical protein
MAWIVLLVTHCPVTWFVVSSLSCVPSIIRNTHQALSGLVEPWIHLTPSSAILADKPSPYAALQALGGWPTASSSDPIHIAQLFLPVHLGTVQVPKVVQTLARTLNSRWPPHTQTSQQPKASTGAQRLRTPTQSSRNLRRGRDSKFTTDGGSAQREPHARVSSDVTGTATTLGGESVTAATSPQPKPGVS